MCVCGLLLVLVGLLGCAMNKGRSLSLFIGAVRPNIILQPWFLSAILKYGLESLENDFVTKQELKE